MSMTTVSFELVPIALEVIDGTTFEKFIHAFYPSISGEDFIPLGGTGDGGADGFQDISLVLGKSSNCYYQISKVEDHKSKIRATIDRLHEFGREVNTLIYITSRQIKYIDIEEANLSAELKTNIKIRDGSFIQSKINRDNSTREAFNTYLRPHLDFLRRINENHLGINPELFGSPAIYVFLRQEIERKSGKVGLINALADGLIIWALEGTDPDKGIFLSENEIIEKIEKTVPAAKKILKGIIPLRLKVLSKDLKSSSRPIRWHQKQNQFCLSYEHRKNIESENAEDIHLKSSVENSFTARLIKKSETTFDEKQRQQIVDMAFQVMNLTFETEGIEFASFLKGEKSEIPQITFEDHIEKALINNSIAQTSFASYKIALLEVLKGAFYNSTDEERLYFHKLSSTYTLLFCLNTEPRIVEYFQKMASDFYLFVGSDVFVMALSERYLNDADKMMTNSLKIIKSAQGILSLTSCVLEEIYTHICGSDFEYINYFKSLESSMTPEIAESSDKILIRAYYDSKFNPPDGNKSCPDWETFINQFCDYQKLHKPEGKEQIKNYLLAKFSMQFINSEELAKLFNEAEAERFATVIENEKKDKRLAKNDAKLVLAVYGRRRKHNESSNLTEYGFRTWWLTNQLRILKYTDEIIKKNGANFIMRPEFVLKFITLAPSTSEILKTYKSIFPSFLGIQLARRVDQSELDDIHTKMTEAKNLEPERRAAVIATLSNELKGRVFSTRDPRFTQ